MKKEKKILYVVLDESGAMHLKDERYFVIGGFVTTNLKEIIFTHRRIEKKMFENRKKEIKSNTMSINKHSKLLEHILDKNIIIPTYIVVDKKNLYGLNVSENVAYNFFVKTLLKRINSVGITLKDYDQICLRLDSRSCAVKERKQLDDYLKIEFYANNLTVNYYNSEMYREIRVADL